MKSIVVFTCLVAAASATYIDGTDMDGNGRIGVNGWVNGYGFNAFPGINSGFHNGYHGFNYLNDFNGVNGYPGYNYRHLYNNGYDAGYFNGYNNGHTYNTPHKLARFGFDQPLGGVNGYYAHPEAVDVFQTPDGEPLFPNILQQGSFGGGMQQQQQQQRR